MVQKYLLITPIQHPQWRQEPIVEPFGPLRLPLWKHAAADDGNRRPVAVHGSEDSLGPVRWRKAIVIGEGEQLALAKAQRLAAREPDPATIRHSIVDIAHGRDRAAKLLGFLRFERVIDNEDAQILRT
jgi:hypothetical protein